MDSWLVNGTRNGERVLLIAGEGEKDNLLAKVIKLMPVEVPVAYLGLVSLAGVVPDPFADQAWPHWVAKALAFIGVLLVIPVFFGRRGIHWNYRTQKGKKIQGRARLQILIGMVGFLMYALALGGIFKLGASYGALLPSNLDWIDGLLLPWHEAIGIFSLAFFLFIVGVWNPELLEEDDPDE